MDEICYILLKKNDIMNMYFSEKMGYIYLVEILGICDEYKRWKW